MQRLETKLPAFEKDSSLVLVTGSYGVLKRVVDWLAGAGLLLLFSPLIFFIALLIKLDSPGPVLYKQERVGWQGRPFFMLKFRSMKTHNSPQAHRQYLQRIIRENLRPEDLGKSSLKETADPRITRVGKIIRKLSLDELPQFINVLRGDMSIVGPRPSIPYEYEVYKEWHKQRLDVLPGITGLWQVNGRNQVSFDEMVRLDLHYIEQKSIWLDLKIMLKTPFIMLQGKGGG